MTMLSPIQKRIVRFAFRYFLIRYNLYFEFLTGLEYNETDKYFSSHLDWDTAPHYYIDNAFNWDFFEDIEWADYSNQWEIFARWFDTECKKNFVPSKKKIIEKIEYIFNNLENDD